MEDWDESRGSRSEIHSNYWDVRKYSLGNIANILFNIINL